MLVIAAGIKYRSLIGVWAICSVNTKEWIIKFDFRGERGQGTLRETTAFEGNTKSTAGIHVGGVGQVLCQGRGPS